MTSNTRRDHRFRIIAYLFLAAIGAYGLFQAHQATVTNQQAIHVIQHDRRVRIDQINEAALTLCGYAHDSRELQRQSIREQPAVVAARFKLAGATVVQTRMVRAVTQLRTNTLLVRYPAIRCPRTFVRGE